MLRRKEDFNEQAFKDFLLKSGKLIIEDEEIWKDFEEFIRNKKFNYNTGAFKNYEGKDGLKYEIEVDALKGRFTGKVSRADGDMVKYLHKVF